ncbi:hypothetical protein KAT92_05525 [Candidatus Babeliales bacterium]|nr:hypothetical protein [Candidatus Babeliales bacterium]
MAEYLVSWEIDVEADSSKEAAEIAAKTLKGQNLEALVFKVLNERTNNHVLVNLLKGDDIPWLKKGHQNE